MPGELPKRRMFPHITGGHLRVSSPSLGPTSPEQPSSSPQDTEQRQVGCKKQTRD